MKKIYVLPLIVLLFAACSVDNDLNEEDNTANTLVQKEEAAPASTPLSSCFTNLAAHVSVDVSAGLNNPVVNFIADAPADASGGFMMKVEIRALSDCEDLNSGTGAITALGNSTVFYGIASTPAQVSVTPAQLTLPCYKWRILLQGVSGSGREITCTTVSPWYDAPLF